MSKLFLFSLLFFICCEQKPPLKKERMGLLFKAALGSWHNSDGYNYLSIKTSLINNTPDTVRYVNMYCDSDRIYVIDTKKLNIHWIECNKNFPEIHILFPYQIETSGIESRTQEDTNNLKGIKFRVGINYISARNNEEAVQKFDSLGNQKHLLWSDTLEIK